MRNEIIEQMIALVEEYRKTEKLLGRTVVLSHSQVDILVAKELIAKRNKCKDPEKQKAFDIVLRGWYLDEDEFERYVLNGEDVS